jgi:hypothetical protein
MKKNIIICFALLFLLTACNSYDVNGTSPVRYASSVQIITLDSTKRPFSKSIEVIQTKDDLHGRAYHKIALLSHEAWPNDENMVINALIWKAKSLGADGVILLPRSSNGYEFNPFAHSGVKFNYEAQAIVFEQSNPTP